MWVCVFWHWCLCGGRFFVPKYSYLKCLEHFTFYTLLVIFVGETPKSPAQLRLVLIEGDHSPKSPFLRATSAKSKKMESKTTLHFVSHKWRSIFTLHQSPFHQLPNHVHDSLFFITPPQQPNSTNKTRTTMKTTTIKQQHNKQHLQNNKSTRTTNMKPTTNTHHYNNQTAPMKQQQTTNTTTI